MGDRDLLADRIASVVLAGGQGTRLFPLTKARCKPAVAFGGHYRLIDIPISNSLNSDIHRLFVIAQYFASELQNHLLSTYHTDLFGSGRFEMLCPEETMEGKRWFRGTADAVRQSLPYLLRSPAEYFLILSGDQLYQMDLLKVVQCAVEQKADFVVAALRVNREDAKRMGVLKIDSSNTIVDFYEKPDRPELFDAFCYGGEEQFLGSMGIYVFHRDVLREILKEEPGDDFGRHIIPSQIKKRRAVAFVYEGYWEDIGTISSYYKANLALTWQHSPLNMYDENNPIYACPYHLPSPIIKNTTIQNSIISQGAIIDSQEITQSIVGIRTHIKSGTIIQNAIILGNHCYHPPLHKHSPIPGNFTIGEDCHIKNAIIDEHTYIGDGVSLTNEKKVERFDGDGVYIRDGIIIVTSGTYVPSGFKL